PSSSDPPPLPSSPTRRSSDLSALGHRPEAGRDRRSERRPGTRLGLADAPVDDGDHPPAERMSDLPAGGDEEQGSALEVDALEERSEEHTSELQSRVDLVCRLL